MTSVLPTVLSPSASPRRPSLYHYSQHANQTGLPGHRQQGRKGLGGIHQFLSAPVRTILQQASAPTASSSLHSTTTTSTTKLWLCATTPDILATQSPPPSPSLRKLPPRTGPTRLGQQRGAELRRQPAKLIPCPAGRCTHRARAD